MRKETITKGTQISTLSGYMVATGFNGTIVYLDEYETDEDGQEQKIGERRLTLSEIAQEMKSVDGMNHKVIWEEYSEDMEEDIISDALDHLITVSSDKDIADYAGMYANDYISSKYGTELNATEIDYLASETVDRFDRL